MQETFRPVVGGRVVGYPAGARANGVAGHR